MYYYRIYGLNVASEREIENWGSININSNIDVRVDFNSIYSIPDLVNVNFNFSLEHKECIVFELNLSEGSARYTIGEDGSSINVALTRDAQFSEVSHFLSSIIFGIVLRLKGVLCLHASVVFLDSSAVAFVGPSGAGKSTISAAFHQQGFNCVSEDLMALDRSGTSYFVRSGYRGIRLYADSLKHILGPHAVERALPAGHKSMHKLTVGQLTPSKLDAIYLLATRDPKLQQPEIVSISQTKALVAMTSQLYLHHNLGARWIGRDFPRLGQLVEAVSVYNLKRTSRFEDIDAMISLVLNHQGVKSQ